MNISGPGGVAIGSSVWASTTRSLTNAGFIVRQQGQNQSLPASTSTNFAPAAGYIQIVTIAIKAGAGGTGVVNLNDGTTNFVQTTVTAAQTGACSSLLITEGLIAILKNNDAANPLIYAYGIEAILP